MSPAPNLSHTRNWQSLPLQNPSTVDDDDDDDDTRVLSWLSCVSYISSNARRHTQSRKFLRIKSTGKNTQQPHLETTQKKTRKMKKTVWRDVLIIVHLCIRSHKERRYFCILHLASLESYVRLNSNISRQLYGTQDKTDTFHLQRSTTVQALGRRQHAGGCVVQTSADRCMVQTIDKLANR